MAASCPTFSNSPPIPACSPAHPPAKKVAVIETPASIKEIAEEDEEWVVGRLSKDAYNQDFEWENHFDAGTPHCNS